MNGIVRFSFFVLFLGMTHISFAQVTGTMTWVDLGSDNSGLCVSSTDCATSTYCYGLAYTPGATGIVTDYTTGFFINCVATGNPVISNASCIMNDNSLSIDACPTAVLFNSSGNSGTVSYDLGTSYIIHQICFTAAIGETLTITEDIATNLTVSIDLPGGGAVTDAPDYLPFVIETSCGRCNTGLIRN